MRRHFIYTLWWYFATFVVSAMLAFFAIWNWMDRLHAGHRGFAESYQQIRHSGVFVQMERCWVHGTCNKENRNRDTLQEDVTLFNKGTGATEDERFYQHSGIDFRALGRAIVKRGLLGQTNAGGGSTITQQLAKQLLIRKGIEYPGACCCRNR